ncbi:hypothetical protein HRbin11_01014 [bacterium HR11]|nr:hypothetical protein HRbin11_01014 [bacterium HR11]
MRWMTFAAIRDRIVNNPGFQTLDEVRRAGYRIVKERNGDRYFPARPAVAQLVKDRLVKARSV